jgi:acyl-CoA synthetase (AMP-forming)/AMP-acid ligase II
MKGIPLPVEYEPRDIPSLLLARATAQPDAPAIHAKSLTGTYDSLSFRGLVRRVQQLAAALREHGIAPGDRVAWALDNSCGLDALCLFHAVLWLGAVNVPINTRLVAAERGDILGRSNAVVHINRDADTVDRAGVASCSIESLVAELDRLGPMLPPNPTDAEAVATILFTSGTTGRAKGVVHTHGSSLAAGISWAAAFGLGPADRLQSPFPVFSGAGLHFNGLNCLWSGAEYVIDDYDTSASLRLVRERQSTVYVAVPAIYSFWLDDALCDATHLGSLRLLDYGGSAMAPSLIEMLRERLPAVGLMQTYGLTEAGPGGTYLAPSDALTRLGSIGKTCAGDFMSVRVIADDGSDVRPGETGELLLRGAAVMDGYLDDPDATAAAFDDGWLRSGDIVRVDDDGYLYVVDRKKDIIVRGGFNVSSAEVEAALLANPHIQEAAVIAVPHDRLGEDIHAFVVLRPGRSATEADALLDVGDRLADFKRPRSISFSGELPRNAAGKVQKHLLRAQWRGEHVH